jgi:hypothetical protein
MTKTAPSEFSSVSELDYDPISSTFAQLRAVISQEASLRRKLDSLLREKVKSARAELQKAQNYLELVGAQEAQMRRVLKEESAAANGASACLGPCQTVDDPLMPWQMHDRAWNAFEVATGWGLEKEVVGSERLWEPNTIKFEVDRKRIEDERLKKHEEKKITTQKAAELAMQQTTLIAEIEAMKVRLAGVRQRQLEEAEIAAWERARTLEYEEHLAYESEQLEYEMMLEAKARIEEEEILEQKEIEAEICRLAREEATELARLEWCRLEEEATEGQRIQDEMFEEEERRWALEEHMNLGSTAGWWACCDV